MQQECDAWREKVNRLSDEVAQLHQENATLQEELAQASEKNAGLARQLQETSAIKMVVTLYMCTIIVHNLCV